MTMVGSLYFILLVAVVAGIVYLQRNQANIRGKIGEKIVATRLSSLSDEYFVFDDVYIKVGDRSVQIDHVVVSPYGVFVIETKNYKGRIYGAEHSEFWTKNVYGNKYQFRNPLKQNYSHILALRTVLNLAEDKFVPVVVFTDKADLRCKTRGTVIYSSQLKRFISCYTEKLFSSEEVKRLIELLTEANISSKNRKREHVSALRSKVLERTQLVNRGVCPYCRGRLVKRHGRYGDFLGCSNYPKCKFTESL